jgi:hypothetical protein
MADEILIRVKAHYEEDYDGSRGDTDLRQEVVTIEELMREQPEYMFQWKGYVMVDPKNGKIDQKTAELLRSHGWVHADTAKDREERKVLEQEYYLLDEQGKQSYFYEPKFSKIDIDNLTDEQLKQLARSGKIVQVVGPKSVLPPAQYKKLQTKREQLEKQKAAAKEAAVKKAEKKKQKEIAAAKKLLEEAGVK